MTLDISRRDLIAALGGVVAWPFAGRAQQMKRPTIGLLGGATASAQAQWTAAFVQRLGELGWVEGQTVAIEYRWVDGDFNRSPAVIAEFVRLNVDVIVTHATPNVLAAKRVTSAIPIVFASAGDPVGNGIVASLARPGGNITGLSVRSADSANKLVEVSRDLLPNLARLGFLLHVGNPVANLQKQAVQAAADAFGLQVVVAEIRGAGEIASAIEQFKGRIEALVVPSEPLYNTNRIQINKSALKAQLPTIYFDRLYVEAGGLMSYGVNWISMWRRAADFVDKILRGAKPADIPIEQPKTFELVVNNRTAKALGLTVPWTVLTLADRVIE
jgi:putative ABC transport system substrate-binding protein